MTKATADIEIDENNFEVRRNGAVIWMRPKEFELLRALAKRAGKVVSRSELLARVWGYDPKVVSRTIDTHLGELRRRLGHTSEEPGYIETVSRRGYRLRA